MFLREKFLCSHSGIFNVTAKVNAYIMKILGKVELSSIHAT